jgi:hypothetical protein
MRANHIRAFSRVAFYALAENSDRPRILSRALQGNLHIALTHEAGKLFAPLDQQDAVFRSEIVEGQRVQFPRRVDAIKIDMKEIRPRPTIFVDQRKGRTGDIFLGSRFERRGNSLHQRGFARAQIAAQQHDLRRSEHLDEASPKRDSLLRRVGRNLAQDVFCFGLRIHLDSISGRTRP